MKRILVLLSVLGFLLFLATPAFGDTKGGPTDIHFSHVEPNEPLVVLRIIEVDGKTWAIAEYVPRYRNSLLVRLPYVRRVHRMRYPLLVVGDRIIGSIWKTHGGWVAVPKP